MKMTKKIIAVFISMLMALSCLGVFASAATETDAEADLAAYNETGKLYTEADIYSAIDKDTYTDVKIIIDNLLGQFLTPGTIKNLIYSDAGATTIAKALGKMLYPSAVNNALHINAIRYEFPEVYAAITNANGTAKTWDEIDLEGTLPWGIETGNRTQFARVLVLCTSGLGSIVDFVELMASVGAMPFSTFWGDILADVFEAFHIGPVTSTEVFQAAASQQQRIPSMTLIAETLCDVIDAIDADPLNVLCDVLPDVAFSWNENIEAIEYAILFNGITVDLPDFNGLLAAVTSDMGITLPEIDVEALYSMGTASVVESSTTDGFRMQVSGNADVLPAIANYLIKVLRVEGNADAVGALLSGADSTVQTLVNALLKIASNESASGVLSFFAKIVSFFSTIYKFFTDLFSSLGGIFGNIGA